MSTAIIIPAYNEEATIKEVVLKVKQYTSNIIVVNDGSSDNTSKKAEEAGAKVLDHIINLGKGGAARTGCDYAVINNFKKIILLDADGQHDPKEIPEIVESLDKNDIVFSFRKYNQNMPLILRFGNFVINSTIKLLYGIKIKDSTCGYRGFTNHVYKKIRWRSSGYSMESEMIARAGKTGLKYTQIPIETIYSDKYKGTTVLDGIKIVINLLFWRFK
jgi:polyprenyl-phospho-N-acetylgalactosaminyl synthase